MWSFITVARQCFIISLLLLIWPYISFLSADLNGKFQSENLDDPLINLNNEDENENVNVNLNSNSSLSSRTVTKSDVSMTLKTTELNKNMSTGTDLNQTDVNNIDIVTTDEAAVESATVESATVGSATVRSATVESATVRSATVESTTVESATVESATVGSATVESVTVESTTVGSATVESTTFSDWLSNVSIIATASHKEMTSPPTLPANKNDPIQPVLPSESPLTTKNATSTPVSMTSPKPVVMPITAPIPEQPIQPINDDTTVYPLSKLTTTTTQSISTTSKIKPTVHPIRQNCYINLINKTESRIIDKNGTELNKSREITLQPNADLEFQCSNNSFVYYFNQVYYERKTEKHKTDRMSLNCREKGFDRGQEIFNLTSKDIRCVSSCSQQYSKLFLSSEEKRLMYLPAPFYTSKLKTETCIWKIYNLSSIQIKYDSDNVSSIKDLINVAPFMCVIDNFVSKQRDCFHTTKTEVNTGSDSVSVHQKRYPDEHVSNWTFTCPSRECTIVFKHDERLHDGDKIKFKNIEIELIGMNSHHNRVPLTIPAQKPKNGDNNDNFVGDDMGVFESSTQVIISIVAAVIIVLVIIVSVWAYHSWHFKQYSSPLRKLFRQTPLDYIPQRFDSRSLYETNRIQLDSANSARSSQRSLSKRLSDRLGSKRNLHKESNRSRDNSLSMSNSYSSNADSNLNLTHQHDEIQETSLVFLHVPTTSSKGEAWGRSPLDNNAFVRGEDD